MECKISLIIEKDNIMYLEVSVGIEKTLKGIKNIYLIFEKFDLKFMIRPLVTKLSRSSYVVFM